MYLYKINYLFVNNFMLLIIFYMGENPGSNREPLVPQTNVLPIKLFPPFLTYFTFN